MTRNGTLSARRSPEHDYSSPGTYYLELPVREESPPLVRNRKGRRDLTPEGRELLREVGESLHRQGAHLHLDALDVQPLLVVLVLTVVSRPRLLRRLLLLMSETLYQRRMALIPLFVGRLKMNSARRINRLRGREGGAYWCEGYRDRVLFDPAEAAAVVERVGMGFAEVVLREDGDERGVEGMVLGWAYVVTLPTGERVWPDADSCIRIPAGRGGCQAAPGLAPGEMTPRDRASPRILALERWRA